MKIRSLLSAMLGVSMAATLATAGVEAAEAAAADPLIAQGSVRSAAGRPLEGVLVVARAEHDQGRRTVQIELARTTTDTAGEFELEGELRGPADRNADGSVRIEIMALATDVVRYYVVNAHPPAGSGDDWTWSQTHADPSMVTAGRTLRTSDLAGERLTDLSLSLGADPSGRVTAKQARADAREAELARPCSETAYVYYKETDDKVRRGVPVHFAYVANKTKHRFEYETTTDTSLSVAYTGVGKNYSGGLTGSTHNDTSAGLVGTKGGGSKYTPFLWKLEWEYRREEKWCFNAGYPYPMGRSRWLPTRWTGGNWVGHDATPFACNVDFRVPSSHDFWVQRVTSSTWRGWFAIGGVELSSSQQRGSRIKGTYVLRNGKGRMLLCGNDDVPVDASFVEEVTSS